MVAARVAPIAPIEAALGLATVARWRAVRSRGHLLSSAPLLDLKATRRIRASGGTGAAAALAWRVPSQWGSTAATAAGTDLGRVEGRQREVQRAAAPPVAASATRGPQLGMDAERGLHSHPVADPSPPPAPLSGETAREVVHRLLVEEARTFAIAPALAWSAQWREARHGVDPQSSRQRSLIDLIRRSAPAAGMNGRLDSHGRSGGSEPLVQQRRARPRVSDALPALVFGERGAVGDRSRHAAVPVSASVTPARPPPSLETSAGPGTRRATQVMPHLAGALADPQMGEGTGAQLENVRTTVSDAVLSEGAAGAGLTEAKP